MLLRGVFIKADFHPDKTALSPFLSVKSLASHLDCKGPSFTLDVIQSISYILHRVCPSEADIINGYKAVSNTEDDFWPSNGEEDQEEEAVSRAETDGTKPHTTHQQAFKRRRVGLDERRERPPSDQSSTCTSGVTRYSVTMQNATTFSVSSTSIHSGFTSAGAHLQDLAHRKPGSATEIDQDTYSKRKSTDQSSTGNKKSNTSFKQDRNRQLEKVNSGQGTLLSFFSQPSNWGCASREHPAREPSPALLVASPPPKTLPKSLDGELPIPKPREPMLPIPQPFAEHRLQSTPIHTRPSKIPQGPDHATKQYPFFSSSPPPIESLIEEAEGSEDTSHNQNLTQIVSQIPDIRPATTFHTTSTAQVRSVQATGRTLGVRRSMNGWTNRGGHGFSVPGRVNSR